METRSSSQGKRKRDDFDEDGDADIKLEEPTAQGGITFDDGEDDSDEDEDSSDGEGEDGDGDITGECKHDESMERYPQCLAYDPEFVRIGERLVDIPSEIMKIIDKSGCTSARAQSCRENAQDLARIPPSKREKIALLGNTGVGKSSLLNGLLDMPKLAKAIAAGQSCTHVATEYESAFVNQETKFAAIVEYFNLEEIKGLLEKLLQDYNLWHFDKPGDMDQDEEKELKSQALTAFDAFNALFRDPLEMASPTATTDFLDSMYTDEEKDTVSILTGWCSEMLKDKIDEEGNYAEYISEELQDDFLEQLGPLVFSTSTTVESTLWPLVRRVRVGIKGPRLLEHVVLVDLPGLDDTNKVRANACHDILKSCNSIWVVAKITRAITDTAIDNLLWRYGKIYHIAVICTGIDENLDPGLAHSLALENQSIGDHDELFEREKWLRRAQRKYLKMIETRHAKLEGRAPVRQGKKRKPLTQGAKERTRAQIAKIENTLKEVQEELPGVALKRFELLVDARNAFTKRRIEEDKEDYLPENKKVRVFCVSNMHYDALKGSRVVNGPLLSAESTGIPGLRSFVLAATASFPRNTMENYISHKFTVFMQGLGMWANCYAVEGGVELLEAVEKPQERVDLILQNYHKAFMDAGTALVISPLSGNLTEVVDKAKAAVEKKRKWWWSTVRAFVRKEGNHGTSVAPKKSWNESFMEGATEIAKKQWKEFETRHTEIEQKLQEKLVGLVEKIEDVVKSHPNSAHLPMVRLSTMFEAQRLGIEQACAEHAEALQTDLRNIFLDLTQDRYSGYFTQAMLEAYEKCKTDKGPGIKSRTLANLEQHIAQGGKKCPFSVMCKKLTNTISKAARAKNKALGRKIEDILKDIHRQLSEVVEQKSDDEAEEELRVRIREFLERAAPGFEGIKGDLEGLKGRYGVKGAA